MLDLQGDVVVFLWVARFFRWLIIVTMSALLLHIALDLNRRLREARPTSSNAPDDTPEQKES
jgi:hypothetical protein